MTNVIGATATECVLVSTSPESLVLPRSGSVSPRKPLPLFYLV
jgi:hypothetical protein